MAQTSFEISFDGPEVDHGQIPARELGPSLLSLADLFTTASLALYPDNDPARLDVVAHRQGSFDVELVLHGAGMAWDQVRAHPLETAGALALLKGAVVGNSVDLSLFGLIKRLRGRDIEAEAELPELGVVILTVDGEELRTPAEVVWLNRLPAIRRDARRVVQPLRHKGIDDIGFRTDGKRTVGLKKEDVGSFEVPVEVEEDVLSEQEIDIHLEVLSPTFESDRWKFGGMGEKFTAPIEDAEFMRRVGRHEEVFGAGDELHVTLRLVQTRDPASRKLRTSREIVKVHETVPAPQQLDFQSHSKDPPGSLPAGT